MALFKIFKGASNTLSNQKGTEGYAYFTPDTGHLYIDIASTTGSPTVAYSTSANSNATRIKVAAGIADKVAKAITFTTNAGDTGITFDGSTARTVGYATVGAASSTHTHTTTVASTSDSSNTTLGFGAKYKITAGGTSTVILMPSLGTSSTTAAAGNHTHATLTIQGAGTTAGAYTPGSSSAMTVNIVAGTNMTVAGASGKITITGNYPIASADTAGIVKATRNTGTITLTTGTTTGRYYTVEAKADGTLFVNVPWTNTWNALSTSQPGYVPEKAPNDTTKFLRGDATWATLPLTLSPQTTGFKISGGTTTSKTLTVSESYTLAAACAKGVDTSMTASSTSTNLPTTAAVATLIASLDFASIGVAAGTGNRYVCQISETDGKISAVLATATFGSANQPVWIESGVIKAGNTYGGGTAVTLNGTSKAATTASFYAPTASGTANQILTSGGANTAPSWKATGNGAAYATSTNGALTFGTLPIAQGGTGTATAPTQWGVIYASSTTAYASTAAGTAGYVLQSNATSAPTWINATNSNTASTIVKRDSNGDFASRWITATRIIATSTTDATGTTAANVALITGAADGVHIEYDNNEIQAKATGTTVGGLSLNYDGGNIVLGVNNTSYNVAIRSTMASSSKTTGALVVGGGAGFGGTVYANAFNGPLTGNVTGNVTGNLTGNADTATKFAAAQSVTLTGDVTGTASSQAGWSIATTIKNSGVTAASYGPSANATPAFGGTFSVPYFTVNAKGLITAASTKTITVPALGTTATTAAAGNHTHSTYVVRAGDTSITGNLVGTKAGGLYFATKNSTNDVQVGVYASTNHGLYSWAYSVTSGETTTNYGAGWIVYRETSSGNAKSSFKLYSAVWNDYAEYRHTDISIEPGRVIVDLDNGKMILATKRLIPGAQIVSDTFGFAIGQNNYNNTPTAVSGRALVYTYQPRENYHAGMAVCSAPNGTIDIMTREEIMMYPDAIIGIVSEIPDYDIWHAGSKEAPEDIQVNSRIWIKVR